MTDPILKAVKANDDVVSYEEDTVFTLIWKYRDLGVALLEAQGNRKQSELIAAVNARAIKENGYELAQSRASRAMTIARLSDEQILDAFNKLPRVTFSAFIAAITKTEGRPTTPAQKGKAFRKQLDKMSAADRNAWLKAAGLKLA